MALTSRMDSGYYPYLSYRFSTIEWRDPSSYQQSYQLFQAASKPDIALRRLIHDVWLDIAFFDIFKSERASRLRGIICGLVKNSGYYWGGMCDKDQRFDH